ncbi:MAG: GGDEF domain-containing phosphodiesterase [Clostridia bacterium]
MTAGQYFNSIFKEAKFIYFVAELQTNIIISTNEAFVDLLPGKQQIIGKTFNELSINGTSKCPFIFEDNWKQSDIMSADVFVEKTGKHYTITNTKVEYLGTYYNLCKILMSDKEKNGDITFEEAMTNCIATFNQPHETILTSLMEILASFYDSDRAYAYKVDYKNATIHRIAEWCLDKEFHVTEDVETRIDARPWLDWVKTHQDFGIVHFDPESEECKENLQSSVILKAFQMENCMLGFIEDDNKEIIGMVGFSNYHSHKADLRLLRAMTHFVLNNLNRETIDTTTSILNNDMLTGTYIRTVYADHIAQISQEPPKSLGVLSINVNGLKQINDKFGINEGDKRIKNTATRLKEHFGYDFYRLSGDEFVGLAKNISKEEFENKIIQLHTDMRAEENFEFAIGHSWAEKSIDYHSMIIEAENIMYINKQEYYHLSQRQFDTISNKILSDLLTYIENDEFMIYLQPQVKLKDGSLYGAEALIRRFDKTNQKMVFPDQFIALYEQNSVIRHIDIFVLESVCKLLQEWIKIGKVIPISVNLSRVTLQEYGIVDTIVEICDKYEVPHNYLVIEVTERVGLVENNVASALIMQFKENGFNISLDDFGCAYSNIVTLAQIAVDEVKIDKSLVDDLTTNVKNHILVKNVLTMCSELDSTSTLAEGIEDENQANLLYELGCHLGQGYFYSRPVPVSDFYKKYIE